MIICESSNFDKIMGAYEALTSLGYFTKGSEPIKKACIMSYVLVKKGGQLNCEYRVKKVDTEIITEQEFQERFILDDIPF